MEREIRSLPDADARGLIPGSAHYTAYVGPPEQYDIMGATQFMLLVTLGMRSDHRVLDFGCGSLRAGRLLIPYLARGNYHGVEPNSWLIDDAISRQIGRDQVVLKWPHFYDFDDFLPPRCGAGFDFAIAQSIFSHAGADIVERVLRGFAAVLKKDGLAVVTFIHQGQDNLTVLGDKGWVYPECVSYTPEMIAGMIECSGLCGRSIPWFHPRQTWYALARDAARLPGPELDHCLRGAITNVPDWRGSL